MSPSAATPLVVRQAEWAAPAAQPPSLDLLVAQWQIALDAAQSALGAASLYLAPHELGERSRRLTEERTVTTRLLEAVARDQHSGIQLFRRLALPHVTRQMLGLPVDIVACVFDLDGVLTASAALHSAAWAEAFEDFLLRRADLGHGQYAPYPYDPYADYQEHMAGKPRLDGVRAFLASRGISLPEGSPEDYPGAETVHGLANRKNEALQRRLGEQGVAAFEGSRRYLEAARSVGIHRAVVSASANTQAILERAGLAHLIEQRVDGNTIRAERLRGKPAPDTLLAACRQLGIQPRQTAVFETAPAGIAAARGGGFKLVVGVDRGGQPEALRTEGADLVVADLAELLDQDLAA